MNHKQNIYHGSASQGGSPMQICEIMEQIIHQCQIYHAQIVILFGSRAKETTTLRSDIDIAVSGVTDTDGLREALDEIPTLYKIDLVDLDTCKNTLLLEDIKQYGRKIYEKI
jgi:predicted nucleotidyltransferase